MLTALSDERIDAVAAIFPEGIAARQVMKHTYRTYGGRWPLAFHPYYQLGIDRRIETPAFDKLMQIEDPIEYPHGRARAASCAEVFHRRRRRRTLSARQHAVLFE